MKSISSYLFYLLIPATNLAQEHINESGYTITISQTKSPFSSQSNWLGGDGASSIDLGNNRILWLFGDSFIGNGKSDERKDAVLINNCIAIQQGKAFQFQDFNLYWNKEKNQPQSFFKGSSKGWYWPGHGAMIKDRLLVFLMRVSRSSGGLGFRVDGWDAALIKNPEQPPSKWKISMIHGEDTKGMLLGTSAVLIKDDCIYTFATDESPLHEARLIRWKIEDAYRGDLLNKEWWTAKGWMVGKDGLEAAKILFSAQTEFSVHYDNKINQYVQVQSYGFGDASIGVRFSNEIWGEWSSPIIIFKPDTVNIKKPLIYSAKAHPEQHRAGTMITYHINSLDFNHLLENTSIYFPRILEIIIKKKQR